MYQLILYFISYYSKMLDIFKYLTGKNTPRICFSYLRQFGRRLGNPSNLTKQKYRNTEIKIQLNQRNMRMLCDF